MPTEPKAGTMPSMVRNSTKVPGRDVSAKVWLRVRVTAVPAARPR